MVPSSKIGAITITTLSLLVAAPGQASEGRRYSNKDMVDGHYKYKLDVCPGSVVRGSWPNVVFAAWNIARINFKVRG